MGIFALLDGPAEKFLKLPCDDPATRGIKIFTERQYACTINFLNYYRIVETFDERLSFFPFNRVNRPRPEQPD